MNLDLTVLASTSIKRKKPWPKMTWLGKDKGGLYLLDKTRISQLYLPSGKTRKKIPTVHPFLVDVQVLSTSSNGQFLAGALKSGKLFVWERDSDTLHTTPILDKIRNVLGSNKKRVSLFISNCGKKIVLLSGLDQLFLWETDGKPLAQGEPFMGRWIQIQSGDYTLPTEQDKENAVDGVFYEDHIQSLCCMVSWVFNKQDRIHITTLRLQWPLSGDRKNFDYDHADASLQFSAKWYMFVCPLHGLTPAKRVLKSSKAYIARFSFDGQVLAVAMNQKAAADTRMMFYSTTSSSVAIVTDLKGCGSANVQNLPPTGRLWWVCDMQWTRNDLFLIIITRSGSVAMLTKLGEPVILSTTDNSLDMGPSLYLPLHPRITFKKPSANGESDTSLSLHSITDDSRQRYSITVHYNLPIILTTDGYLVTIMQLPGNASYKGVMTSLLSSVTRLLPEVQQDPGMVPVSSSISKVDIFQSDTNLSRVTSAEELSEATQSSCSSTLAGYGLASGDQGIAVVPIISDIVHNQRLDKSGKFLEAHNNSLKALAVGVSAGQYWSNDVSTALKFVIKSVVKLFSLYLRDNFEVPLSSSLKMLSKFSHNFEFPSEKIKGCFDYFKMALEMFLWDSKYRNSFTTSVRLIHGIIKEILACKSFPDEHKVFSSIVFLEFAEDVLGSVYSWKESSKTASKGEVIDRFSPNVSIPRDSTTLQKTQEFISEGMEETSQIDSKSEGSTLQESSRVTKALTATWLILYNYTVQSSKRSSRPGDASQFTPFLCDIQKKLQDMDVTIPTEAKEEPHMSVVKSIIDRDDAIPGITDSPGESLFGRRRINRAVQEPNQSTPTHMRKSGSLDRLLDVSAIDRSSSNEYADQRDATTESLLAILYLNLQNYNLRAAIHVVLSLMEPALDRLDTTFSSLFTLDSLRTTRNQDYSTNQLLTILTQTFPMIRVADKCGVPVVQSLGRFMAAYFSNLSVYVFPAYHPNVLPPYYLGERARYESTSDESFTLSQGVEVVHLDREKVALAVRDQGISDFWCANNTIELMLISGLIGEAAWLSDNLGDWKHALILSFSHTLNAYQHTGIPKTLLPTIPSNIIPENIILTRLQPVLSLSPSPLPNIPKNLLDVPEDATSTPNKNRVLIEQPTKDKTHHDMDEKAFKDVGNILEAAVVAGLDVVPVLCARMLQDLLVLVSEMEWIVPEELYLPAPPLFCPQPPHVETEYLLPRVYREKQLRSDIAGSVQKVLTLLHSSNCMSACIQWYVSQLVTTNEKWYNTSKDNQDFIVPKSLLAHTDIVTSFHAADLSLVRAVKRNSAKPKDAPSPPRPSRTPGSSVSLVIQCFHQFCFTMWLLYVRDKMSLCARKYRQARNQAVAKPEMAEQVEGLCWETLQWTLELQPFGSFLGASTQVSDSLLTLLSEMQPSIATAKITAQYFPDPNLIPTTSGRAKYKRLMTQFRGTTLRDAGSIEEDNYDEPLSVFYREKCLEWQDELKERERLFHKVQVEVFPRENDEDDLPNSKPSFVTNKDHPCVGSTLFETSESYLKFLDTFFVITFTKTASELTGQAVTGIPLLLPYEKVLTFNEAKSLKELQAKAAMDKEYKPRSDSNSLHRSQSCVDVSSNRSRKPLSRSHLGSVQTDIRRSSSMNDISKRSANSGMDVLGTRLLDMLPRLSWLSRWSSEGVPTTSINRRTTEGQPVMKVDVELPLLVNSLWLISNVYTPWELNEQVKPEFLKIAAKPAKKPQDAERDVVESPLRRASSDTDIPKVTVQSPTTEEDSILKKEKTEVTKKKIPKYTGQVPKLDAKLETEFDVLRASHTHDSCHAKPSTHKKPKSVRRALKMDVQEQDSKTEKVKTESRRKGKPSNKHSPTKNVNQSDLDHVTIDRVSPVMNAVDLLTLEPDVGHRETVPTPTSHGNQQVNRTNGQTQTVSEGMELVLLLRSNSNSYPNNSDVPLLKLSTVTSKQDQSPVRDTKVANKETASQTDAPKSTNSSTQCANNPERALTYSKVISSNAVDFSSQYDESRDVSCQTGQSSPSNRQRHERSVTYSSQENDVLSHDARQFIGAPSSQQSHFMGAPTCHQSYLDGVQYNNQSLSNGAPSRHQSHFGGMLSRPDYPLQFHRPDLEDYRRQEQPKKTAWPEQSVQNPLEGFPLLHIPRMTQATGDSRRMVSPWTGYPTYGQTSRDSRSFPLLHLPKKITTQPTKTFRLFEIPPASRDLPLLLMPKNQDKQHRPDLSKIKFADIKTKREPFVMLDMDNARSRRGLHVLSHQLPMEKDVQSSPLVLLHIPKENPKTKLVPVEILEAYEQTKQKDPEETFHEKENVKPKKGRERKRKRQIENKEEPPREDARNAPSRQRRRQNMLSSEQAKRNDVENLKAKLIQVNPVHQDKEKKSKKSRERQPPPQLEEGLSEESELELSEMSENFELSDEEQLYFNVQQRKPNVSNEKVDEYCRELEARVKKQFQKELEDLRKQQMEVEVKERVRKEMERQREQDEVRKRLEQERELQERLEREKKTREEKLQEQDISPRPVPRKRSVKWEGGSFVSYDDTPLRDTAIKSTSSVEVQSDLIRTSVDQVTQTAQNDSKVTKQPQQSGQKSFAPVLPPNVLLGLTFDEEPQSTCAIHGVEETDPFDTRNRTVSERQFVSVADIDSKLWEKIRSGNKMTFRHDEKSVEVKEEEAVENEDASQDEEQVPSKESSLASHTVEDDVQEFPKKHDLLTVRLMESFETQKPRPASAINASSLSKQRLSSRLEEMNERFEAIEKITQNMDREFHSSNVLLNAIESIGEIMSPPVKETKTKKKSQGQRSSSILPRGKSDTVPWRRDEPSRELQLNDARETTISFKEENEPDHPNHHHGSFDNQTEQEDVSGSVTPTLELEEEPGDQARDQTESRQQSRDLTGSHEQLRDVAVNDLPSDSFKDGLPRGPTGGQEQTHSAEEFDSSLNSRRTDQDTLQDMAMLSSNTLKEIFTDSHNSSKRTSQRSAEKRKKVQDWMAKKRKERHLEWKNQLGEMRATEFKPFTNVSEGPSTLKKIKLAEKERETKRRARQESQIDERIKDASNLINEMLAEPVPKANTLQNLHYAPTTPKNKTKHNNRYTTKTTSKKPIKKTGPNRSQQREQSKTPLTSSPLYPNKDSKERHIYDRRILDSRFSPGARSVTPSGSEFVTTKTYRMHEKDKLRRSQELEREMYLQQEPNMDTNGLYITAQSIDIDDIMDQIPDGSTINGLNDIDDLLSDDSELKELLTDVLGTRAKNTNKGTGNKGMGKKSGPFFSGTTTWTKNSSRTAKQSARPEPKNTALRGSQEMSKKQVPISSPNKSSVDSPYTNNRLPSNKTTLSRDVFRGKTAEISKDDKRGLINFEDVSPWNTGDSLKMSDDVAQLLAEAKEAIGDSMSESSGSIMSNIDWDAVDKIMNDM